MVEVEDVEIGDKGWMWDWFVCVVKVLWDKFWIVDGVVLVEW